MVIQIWKYIVLRFHLTFDIFYKNGQLTEPEEERGEEEGEREGEGEGETTR